MTTRRIFSITTTTTTLAVILLAAIYLHLGGHVQRDDTTKSTTSKRLEIDQNITGAGVEENTNIFLNLKNEFYYNNGNDPNIEDYVELIEQLRRRLASGNDDHEIAVTRPPASIPLTERFIQVLLENGGGERITVIIDTVNVYVRGYLLGINSPPYYNPKLYYFDEVPTELFHAFSRPNYFPIALGFAGNYDSLGNRATTELGHGALNDAIESLYYRYDQRSALLVVVQMVAEAVRIKHIEHLIRQNMMGNNLNFVPDARAISMENKWSNLSRQTQCSGESGVFRAEIEVRSVSNQVVLITSVLEVMRQAALALMLYKPNFAAVVADEQCPYGEPITNIIGRDGQCVSVKDSKYINGDPIILWPCGNAKQNQLWTFKSDGTIRSNGKCLITFGYAPGNSIMIFDCDTTEREAKKWILFNAGTIMNPASGLVIAAENSTQGSVLKLAHDNNSSRQAWSAGNYTQPAITYITGFREMCLQANGVNARVWLANCVIGTKPRHQWALYGDNTIRHYSDQTLCVTSESLASIILLECQGSGDQRWTFMADGTILNPNAQLVMDVMYSDNTIQLAEPSGKPNQKWLAF